MSNWSVSPRNDIDLLLHRKGYRLEYEPNCNYVAYAPDGTLLNIDRSEQQCWSACYKHDQKQSDAIQAEYKALLDQVSADKKTIIALRRTVASYRGILDGILTLARRNPSMRMLIEHIEIQQQHGVYSDESTGYDTHDDWEELERSTDESREQFYIQDAEYEWPEDGD